MHKSIQNNEVCFGVVTYFTISLQLNVFGILGLFEGFETSNCCFVLAHVEVFKKGIFISHFWKADNRKPRLCLPVLRMKYYQSYNTRLMKHWNSYKSIFIILVVCLFGSLLRTGHLTLLLFFGLHAF